MVLQIAWCAKFIPFPLHILIVELQSPKPLTFFFANRRNLILSFIVAAKVHQRLTAVVPRATWIVDKATHIMESARINPLFVSISSDVPVLIHLETYALAAASTAEIFAPGSILKSENMEMKNVRHRRANESFLSEEAGSFSLSVDLKTHKIVYGSR